MTFKNSVPVFPEKICTIITETLGLLFCIRITAVCFVSHTKLFCIRIKAVCFVSHTKLFCIRITAVCFVSHTKLFCIRITAVCFVSHTKLFCIRITAVCFVSHTKLFCIRITAVCFVSHTKLITWRQSWRHRSFGLWRCFVVFDVSNESFSLYNDGNMALQNVGNYSPSDAV